MMTTTIKSGDGNLSNTKKIFTRTTLSPEGYIQFTKFNGTPNLINIHRHEYKKNHSKFTTREPDGVYYKRLKDQATKCEQSAEREQFTHQDCVWHGDAPIYDDRWPKKSDNFRVVYTS